MILLDRAKEKYNVAYYCNGTTVHREFLCLCVGVFTKLVPQVNKCDMDCFRRQECNFLVNFLFANSQWHRTAILLITDPSGRPRDNRSFTRECSTCRKKRPGFIVISLFSFKSECACPW
jgi:hypothetical protein